jgi:hypothetical protein
MHYPDLSSYEYYLKTPVESVRNIGWLDAAFEFNKGDVDQSLLERLESLISSEGSTDLHVNKIRGVHPCAVCGERGPFEVGLNKVVLGSSELWIPDLVEGHYFAAPSLIYHYIRDHGYLPPIVFSEAVMRMNPNSQFNAQDTYLELVAGHF